MGALAGLLACVATAALLCGCLARVPSEKNRAAIPAEVSAIYLDSGQRYLREAGEAMELVRRATRDSDARVQLSLALERFQSAWERMLLSGDVAGITSVPLALAAERPGDISGAMTDCLDLFSQMMKRLRAADTELLTSGPFVAFRSNLGQLGQPRPESLDELDRSFRVQLELWGLDGRSSESPHYRQLLDLLALAESDPALRGTVPFDWAKAASESMHQGQ